jgi:hypothetical protein
MVELIKAYISTHMQTKITSFPANDCLNFFNVGLLFFSVTHLLRSYRLNIILPEFETRELVNNFRNLTISNEKEHTPKILASLQS